MSSRDVVNEAIAALRSMGARVDTGPPRSEKQIAQTEAALGFELPDEYKEFLRQFGSISIELVRTWLFYGVPEPQPIKDQYVEAFSLGEVDRTDESPDAPYTPVRFIVLADEGDYGNQGCGFVYDGDLEHIRGTDGGRYVERGEYLQMDYWEFLEEQLDQIVARVGDGTDDLVSGSEDEVAARRKLPS